MATTSAPESVTQREIPAQPSPPEQRLISLDAFRGMTIAAMILVNDPGTWSAVYPPLDHAPWNGWTPTDLVFPFFLFIMGVALEFSTAKRNAAGLPSGGRSTLRHVLVRALILFALGLFLNGFPFFHIHRIRIMGVLQRIALCSLFAGLLTLKTTVKTRVIVVAGLLFGYWALMTLVPVPGYGRGHLDPEGNLAAYIDRALMSGHTWKKMWDPEGWLSTLPAIATTLMGGFAGRWLRSAASGSRKVLGLLTAGAAGLVVGEIWNQWFPINKNLWTSSYAVFTAGFACVLLALCYWLVEIKKWKFWTGPFRVFGSNSIAAFVLSGLVAKSWIVFKFTANGAETSTWNYVYRHFFASIGSPQFSSLLFALAFVLMCWMVLAVLYWKKIFIKI